ncbi:FGGY family carbohydrate kinase [Patescibacteria group bacterium AH-259-L07]|nr:FGGY family carbohydrate kinase [Patescibacteria group bacterium AH-259-L07]
MYYLIINLGLKSTRAIVFDEDGSVISSEGLPIKTSIKGDYVEQSAEEWWRKTKQMTRSAIQKIPEYRRKRIQYMSVTSSALCLVAVDKNVNPLREVIMVSDKRAKKEAEIIQGFTQYLDLETNKHFRIDPSFMLPKILWIKKNEPRIFEKAFKFLSPNDFLAAKFTGEFVTDTLNAEKFYFSSKEKQYPKKLLKKLHISTDKLPAVVDPGTSIGTIDPKIAKEVGFNSKITFVITTYDAIAAVFGSGVSENQEMCDMSGTVTSCRAIIKKSDIKPNDAIFVQSFMNEGVHIIGGSNNQGGSIIEWLKQTFYARTKNPYKILEKEASQVSPGASGLVFIPYLLGERVPLWNPNLSGIFFGLERFHTRQHFTRAVCESTAFITLNILKAIEETGVKISRIRLAGGLTRISLINQLKADITVKPISLVKNTEASALGALILIMLGTKQFPSLKSASQSLVRVNDPLYPNRKNYQLYQHLYELHHEIYESLQESFMKRKNIITKFYRGKTYRTISNL